MTQVGKEKVGSILFGRQSTVILISNHPEHFSDRVERGGINLTIDEKQKEVENVLPLLSGKSTFKKGERWNL